MRRARRTLIPCAGVLAFALACQQSGQSPPQGRDRPVSALVLLLVGGAVADGESINTGDIIRGGKRVEVRSKSYCDLQLPDAQSALVVRLRSGARYSIGARIDGSGTRFRLELQRGQGLFRAGKLDPGESIQVVTPIAVASVRGTSFSASVTRNGDVRLQVAEGQVEVRPRLGALESLPPSLLEQSTVLRAAVQAASSKAVVLGAGRQLRVTRAAADEMLRTETVRSLLDFPALKRLQKQSKSDEAAIAQVAAEIDRNFAAAEVTARLTAPLEKLKTTSLVDREVAARRLAGLRSEFTELQPIEPERLRGLLANTEALAEILRERQRTGRGRILRRIELMYGKRSRTVFLKAGGQLRGVVQQRGSDFLIVTPEGVRIVPSSKVKSVSFD